MGRDRHRFGLLCVEEIAEVLNSSEGVHSYGHQKRAKSEVLDRYMASKRASNRHYRGDLHSEIGHNAECKNMRGSC